MAEVDVNSYATTSGNAAASGPNVIETQQPGATGALRQVMVMGDPSTRGNMAAVGANGQLYMQGYQPSTIAFTSVTTVAALASQTAAGYNIATLTLRTFTGTTPSITFSLQASDDNTNWVTLQGINNATGQVANSFTQASALTAGTAGPSVDFTIGAYTNVRVNVTAISGTSATAAFGLAFQTMPYEASPGAIAQGTTAVGSATVGNPVLVGATDGTNARMLKTDTSGQLLLGTRTTGGLTTHTLISAATTNATSVKGSAGTVYSIQASNTGAAAAFLKLYNKATAPTVGTDTAVKTLIIPAAGGIVVSTSDIGLAFGTGIAYAITGVATTADTTAVALSQVVVNLDYA